MNFLKKNKKKNPAQKPWDCCKYFATTKKINVLLKVYTKQYF